MTPSPFLAWIATGGTFAGQGAGHTYTAGALAAETLQARWGLHAPIPVRITTPYQIDSKEATPDHWRRLHAAVIAALADPACAAVVVTHGTDTLEESAALLALTVAAHRPVVLTGAMRPADDPTTDAPANWQQAVAVALDPATPAGVYVAFAGACYPALGVRKVTTDALVAFAAPASAVSFSAAPTAAIPANASPDAAAQPCSVPASPPPSLPFPASWPKVALLSCTAFDDPATLTAAVAQESRAIVLLCPGHGSLPSAWASAIAAATATGTPVVRASRCPLGPVRPHPLDDALGTWPAGRLNAAQARVALALLVAAAPLSPKTLWWEITQP